MTSAEYDRLEDVLPLYVTGRAHPEERAFVEKMLAQEGETQSLLALHQAMAAGVHERIRLAGRSADLAMKGRRPMAAGADQRPDPVSGSPRGQAGHSATVPSGRATGSGTGWRSGWPVLQGRVWQQSLTAVMATLIFAQTGLLVWAGANWTEHSAAQAKSGIVTEVNTLRVTFAPWATEARIRTTLVGAGARVVGGPTQFGEYWLASSTYSLEELKALLQSSGLVVSIEIDRAGPQGQ